MIEKIKNMILELCEDKEYNWKLHIESVVKYSRKLAQELGADEEICEISAWLHDIKKINGNPEKHHIYGAKEAAVILRDYNYPENRIKMIEHCILTHSSDDKYVPKTIEAKIVASADALSHFNNFLELAHVAFGLKKKSFEDGREWLIEKYKACFNKLKILPEAEKIARDKYEVIGIVLKSKL